MDTKEQVEDPYISELDSIDNNLYKKRRTKQPPPHDVGKGRGLFGKRNSAGSNKMPTTPPTMTPPFSSRMPRTPLTANMPRTPPKTPRTPPKTPRTPGDRPSLQGFWSREKARRGSSVDEGSPRRRGLGSRSFDSDILVI